MGDSRYRTFNTLEQAIRIWRKEADASHPRSGVICRCSCIRDDEERTESSCLLLLPLEVYIRYKQFERQTGKEQPPGVLRIELASVSRDKDNYLTRCELCARRQELDYLLEQIIGQYVTIGINVISKPKKSK